MTLPPAITSATVWTRHTVLGWTMSNMMVGGGVGLVLHGPGMPLDLPREEECDLGAMAYRHGKDGWWITGTWPYTVDGVEYTDYGPYSTKDEVQEALAAIRRTIEEIAGDEKDVPSAAMDAGGTVGARR